MMEDRFQIVDHNNVKLPGSCLICGYGASGRPFIDLGVQVKRYGRLYLCVNCFKECETIVNESIGDPLSRRPVELGNDLPNDVAKPEVAKPTRGRPKGSNTRVAKPSTK